MNRAKICPEPMSAQCSSSKWCSEKYLPKTEGQFVIVDSSRLYVCRTAKGYFRRPYPYTERDQPNGHEEYEWEPATDGPPVR